jgi:hypothetical protein
MDMIESGASLLFLDAHEEESGAVAYETTMLCDQKGAKKQQVCLLSQFQALWQ